MTWLADHWLDLLGWAGSGLLIISLLQTRVLRFRILNLAASLSLIVFNALIQVWPMVAMNLATMAINVWMIRKLVREQHDGAAYTVLPVGPRDPYFQHFLQVHLDDLRRLYPSFEGTRPDDLAYLVLIGYEAVGVVLIRPDGDAARVQLDYVTPRYRDFSPGEFVWRDVEGLRSRGHTRVVTPPGMVDPYYPRLGLGFRREGDTYVMDL